jgi:hypothetical protein
MTNIIAPIISAREFFWEGNIGHADASDLGFRAAEEPFYPLYDDACDVGLVLHSPKSGKDVIFYFEREELKGIDFGAEVEAWRFKSICGKYTLYVNND